MPPSVDADGFGNCVAETPVVVIITVPLASGR
jgi:hypothetical protein